MMKDELIEISKKDLIVIETRNGIRYLIVNSYLIGETGKTNLDNFSDNLCNCYEENFDIVKVYSTEDVKFSCIMNLTSSTLIWSRKSEKELKIEEIESAIKKLQEQVKELKGE